MAAQEQFGNGHACERCGRATHEMERGGTDVTLVPPSTGKDAPGLTSDVALAAGVHDRVVPRLCGVALVLAVEGQLAADLRERCHDEVAAAMVELRTLLLGAAKAGEAVPSLAREVRRWQRRGAPLRVTRVEGARVPREHEALVCEVLREAMRNALRHGSPSEVRVGINVDSSRLTVSVVNDGVSQTPGAEGFGAGLHLSAAAAAEHGGSLKWGSEEGERWRVLLTVPLTER